MAKKEITSDKEGKPKKTTPVRAHNPFEEMERMFGSMFPRTRMRPVDWDWPSFAEMKSMAEGKMPKLDIIDREDELLVRAELAGVDKKDIDVSLTDRVLTIKGCTKQESKEEKGDYYHSEITQGSFSRSATLPCDVDGNKARARFEDGILELTIPKFEGSKRRTIEVK